VHVCTSVFTVVDTYVLHLDSNNTRMHTYPSSHSAVARHVSFPLKGLLDEQIYLTRETQELESNVTQRAGRPSGFLLLFF